MRPIKNGRGVHDKDTTRIVGSNGRGCLDMFLAQEDTGMGWDVEFLQSGMNVVNKIKAT